MEGHDSLNLDVLQSCLPCSLKYFKLEVNTTIMLTSFTLTNTNNKLQCLNHHSSWQFNRDSIKTHGMYNRSYTTPLLCYYHGWILFFLQNNLLVLLLYGRDPGNGWDPLFRPSPLRYTRHNVFLLNNVVKCSLHITLARPSQWTILCSVCQWKIKVHFKERIIFIRGTL